MSGEFEIHIVNETLDLLEEDERWSIFASGSSFDLELIAIIK